MNKKEVMEIRRQFTTERCTISRMCSCYITHEKEVVPLPASRFLGLEDTEQAKYFAIFRKALSGTIGKNLLNLEFPQSAERITGQSSGNPSSDGSTPDDSDALLPAAGVSDAKSGETPQDEEGMPVEAQALLMDLLRSRLEDDALTEEFFRRIAASYNYGENYLVLMIYAAYDIPHRSTDGTTLFDGSSHVYPHILVTICPVKESQPELAFDPQSGLHEREREPVIARPMTGILFPAFNDRDTDIHSALYYCAKTDDTQENFFRQILGCPAPWLAPAQKDAFCDVTAEALGENCDFETAKKVQQNLGEMMERAQEEAASLELSGSDVRRLLESSGVPDENLEDFDENFSRAAGEGGTISAVNVADTRKLRVESSGIRITADAGSTDLIETRFIDGRPCLVIEADDHVTVNGVPVRTALTPREKGESAPD